MRLPVLARATGLGGALRPAFPDSLLGSIAAQTLDIAEDFLPLRSQPIQTTGTQFSHESPQLARCRQSSPRILFETYNTQSRTRCEKYPMTAAA